MLAWDNNIKKKVGRGNGQPLFRIILSRMKDLAGFNHPWIQTLWLHNPPGAHPRLRQEQVL